MTSGRLMIFDCDGVLVDSEPLAAIAYVRVYARHGLAITTDIVAQCVGMKQADIFTRIEQLTSHAYPLEHADDVWAETKAVFTESLQPMPGIADFLSRLGTPRCVASSSSIERILHSLTLTGLMPHFGEAIYSSSMVKRGKPAPDLFLFAAQKMGVDPAHCVVIEDSPFGVQGAVAAGMKVVGFTGGGHTTAGHGAQLLAAGADGIFDSWTAVAEAFPDMMGAPAS